MEPNEVLVTGGLVVGLVFGVLVQRFRFCMVAATGNWLLIKDNRQIIAFLAVWLVAIGGTQFLELSGIVAIDEAGYRNSTLDWLGASLGGILFGIGAALAGGCAARTIVRGMEGSLNALLVFVVFALSAAVTQFGFLESSRLALTDMTAIHLTTDAGLASLLSLPAWLVAVVVELFLLIILWRVWKQGGNLPLLIVGIIIGSLVVFSWYITGVLAQDEFDPRAPSAMTVSGPMSRFGYIIISGKIPAFSFAIAFVIGLAIAAFVTALIKKEFKITPIAKGSVVYAVLGGALMGIGGTLGYGCNIGQGLSGLSTLSLESILAVSGIFVGASLGVKWLEKRG